MGDTATSTIPLFDPSGTLRDVPMEQMKDALSAGAKPAVRFQAPDKSVRWVPADKTQDAVKAGGQILPVEQQDKSFWSGKGAALWDDIKGMASGIAHFGDYDPMTDPKLSQDEKMKLVNQDFADADTEVKNRTKQYGSTYANVTAPAAGMMGVNVPGMEQSAAEGSGGGVLGHAAAVPTVMAATEGLTRGIPAIRAAAPGAIESTVDATKAIAAKTPILKSFVDGPPEQLMMKAVKPRSSNTGFTGAVKNALPNMKSAEADLGHPVQGIDDALQVADIAKKKLWKQYQQVLGPAAERGVQLDGNSVADAMMQSIDKRTAMQNPGLVDKVQQVADTYRRPLTVNEAEDFLQSANNDLHSYYAKNKVGRAVAQGDPSVAYTVAEAESLRKALYSKLDEASGPGAADLKRAYGAISNVQEELLNRQNVAARQQPQSLNEQISTARGVGKIAKGVATMSPGDILEGAEGIATSKWMKERNSTDAMISRAFKATEPAVSPVGGSRPIYIKGLLNRGPVPLGSAPDSSGSVPFNHPPVAATTRAQRLGLLLPENTSIDLPASSAEEPMQVLPAKSRIIRDPRTGQMRRQYLPIAQ